MTTDVWEQDNRALAADETVPWDAFAGKTVVVTGATGLIGRSLVGALLAREEYAPTGLCVVALVRNPARLEATFGAHKSLKVVAWDAADPGVSEQDVANADYVFHCANMTDSASFVTQPVEVIETTVGGSRAMLELARRTGAHLCLLSTMETYGEVAGEAMLAEDKGGFLDAMSVRNSYPEAKRLSEALCAAYAAELGVCANVARLAQTFGPGVSLTDRRVFAYFARCAIQGEDIVLLTDGLKRNSYLYTADATRGLLFVAARGDAGRAYNVANDETFCTVRDMATLVITEFGAPGSTVRIELDEEAAKVFRKGSVLRLDTSALQGLGWSAHYGLKEMYARMIAGWNAQVA